MSQECECGLTVDNKLLVCPMHRKAYIENSSVKTQCTCEVMLVDYFTDTPYVARCKTCGGYRKIPKEDMPT